MTRRHGDLHGPLARPDRTLCDLCAERKGVVWMGDEEGLLCEVCAELIEAQDDDA